jgi:raffinose/stachyose/melibiose transport system permease protein
VRRRVVPALARHLVLSLVSLTVLVPIGYVIIASLKTVPDFFGNPYGLPTEWAWDNYARAWDEARLSITLRNSVIVTVTAVAASTLLAAMISYGISRRDRWLAMPLYVLFTGGLLVPGQMVILPLFILLRRIGLFGTLLALILPYTALGLPLGVLILTPLIATMPRELVDAGRVDGAGEWRIFARIVLPLLRPGLASVCILNGVWMWNEFFIPLVLSLNVDTQTMPVGIVSFIGTYSTEWGLVFASVVMATAPVVVAYLALSRQFISGLTAGALKG